MVELKFESLEARDMPSECFVSMRIGEHQKFGRLAENRVFKFTQAPREVRAARYGKIEIFRRIGTCCLDVDPSRVGAREVHVNCADAGFGSVAMRVSLENSSNGGNLQAAQNATADASDTDLPHVRSSRGQQAKEYLREHCLEVCLSQAMQAVLRERPADPVSMLAQKLQVASRARILPDRHPQPAAPSTAQSSGSKDLPQSIAAPVGAVSSDKAPEHRERALPSKPAVTPEKVGQAARDLARSLLQAARSGELVTLIQESGSSKHMGHHDVVGTTRPQAESDSSAQRPADQNEAAISGNSMVRSGAAPRPPEESPEDDAAGQ